MFFSSLKRKPKDNSAEHEAALARSKDIDNIANYETAIACVKGCVFNMRAGDPDVNFAVLDVGVRIMIWDFGKFQPFIFSEQTKDWLQKQFELTDHQTSKVYGLLYSKLHAFLRDQEAKAAKDRRSGESYRNRFSWLADRNDTFNLYR